MNRSSIPAEFQGQSANLASEKQRKFVNDLLNERVFTPKEGETIESVRAAVATLTKKQATAWIQKLLTLPKSVQRADQTRDVVAENNPFRQGSSYNVASNRNGRELGHCGVCGRTLTDEESRARGIGPICAENNGWL